MRTDKKWLITGIVWFLFSVWILFILPIRDYAPTWLLESHDSKFIGLFLALGLVGGPLLIACSFIDDQPLLDGMK